MLGVILFLVIVIISIFLGITIDPFLFAPGVVYFFLSVRIVQTKNAYIVEFLGKFNRILYPGINFIIPIIEYIASTKSLKTQSIKMKVDSYSNDNVRMTVGIDILFFIKETQDDIYKSHYSFDNAMESKSAIISIVDNGIRAKINMISHIEVLSKRDEFSNYLEEILGQKFGTWGYTIDSIQITDIELPPELVKAMNDVKTTERYREAAENEGEAKRILSVKQAEAERETKRLQGLGIAQQREELAKGLKNAVEEFKTALGQDSNPNQIMEIILMTNYLDTLKDIGNSQNSKVIFTDGTPGGLKSIRDSIIQGMEGK